MSQIAERLLSIKSNLPEQCTLIAVSKTKPIGDIQEAYAAGQLDFGENKAQELNEKALALPKELRWHFIGHLQRNKVKYIAQHVHLIHSVDTPKLLAEINKQALKNDRIIDCLLQIKIASEEEKSGMTYLEAKKLIEERAKFPSCRIRGLMGMASFVSDKSQIAEEFFTIKSHFDSLQNMFTDEEAAFDVLSMGMSGDQEEAIAAGSTMLRIGTAIFGSR